MLKLWCILSVLASLFLFFGSPRSDTLIIVLSQTKMGNGLYNSRCDSFHLCDLLSDIGQTRKNPFKNQVSGNNDPATRLIERNDLKKIIINIFFYRVVYCNQPKNKKKKITRHVRVNQILTGTRKHCKTVWKNKNIKNKNIKLMKRSNCHTLIY